MDQIVAVVTYLACMSVVVERLVEFTKMPDSWVQRLGSKQRVNQFMSWTYGCGVAFCSPPPVPFPMESLTAVVVFGLLMSGGSGFWHDILGALNSLKQSRQSK